jgi:hypothetical protein
MRDSIGLVLSKSKKIRKIHLKTKKKCSRKGVVSVQRTGMKKKEHNQERMLLPTQSRPWCSGDLIH